MLLKTDIRKKIEAFKQIILHVEEVKEQFKLKNIEIKKKIRNIPKEKPFDFTEYVQKPKEDNEIDLALFLELPERKTRLYTIIHQ